MLFDIESMYLNAQKIYKYATTNYGYNLFLIDELDSSLLQLLKEALESNDKKKAISLSRKVETQMDSIRDYYCYDHLPYKANFRCLAKDLHAFMKKRWLHHSPDFKHLDKIIRFISTSDYYIIREYLIKRSYGFHYLKEIELDPYDFPSNYIPLEAIMDYTIKQLSIYFKED